jgi:hypothetical protein
MSEQPQMRRKYPFDQIEPILRRNQMTVLTLRAKNLQLRWTGEAESSQGNTGDNPMSPTNPGVCCPRFNPEPWDDKVLTWENKRFVKDRVTSLLHIPLNFGAVMKRNQTIIEAAHANPDAMVILSDENSLWGADVYLAVTADIPGANMATISGTFLSKVFEGPYHNLRQWMREMQTFVAAKGKNLRKQYVYYTTCPKCAKNYGKNYVVILAQI